MERGLADVGLTVPRAHLLWQLQHGGPSTQRGLADTLSTSPRGITGLVDGLSAAGPVARSPHPSDRRVTLVRLTSKGARLAEELAAGHEELAEMLFGDLPNDEVAGFVATSEVPLTRLRARLAITTGDGATVSR